MKLGQVTNTLDGSSVLGRTLDYRRDFVVPMAGIVGLAVATVILLMLWLSVQADHRELRAEQKTAQVAVNFHVDEMRRYLKDCAAWDNSLAHLVVKLDIPWANDNIGPYLFSSQGYENSFVVDGQNRTTYASSKERIVRMDALRYLGEPLKLAIAELRTRPAHADSRASGLVMTSTGHMAAFAVAPIVADKGAVAQPPGGLSFLVLVDLLTPEDAEHIGVNHQLEGLSLTKEGQPANLILKDTLGHVIGGLAWNPRRPGATLRREAIPIVFAVGLCLSLVARKLLGRARTALVDAEKALEEVLLSRERASQQERDARLNLERTVAEVRAENERLNALSLTTRSAAMRQAAQQFEGQIAPIVDTIQANALALTSAAETVRARAGNLLTSMEATTRFAANAEQRSTGVSPEAADFEKCAIDIAREAEVGLALARSATRHGADAQLSLTGLADALSSIDAVVGAIEAISRQTNFLALNATIEAARSGSAGAGFSVVAGEVKALARQTAELTKAVASKITDVRTSADVAVASISEVSGALSRSEDASDAITAAAARQMAGSTVIREGVDSIVTGSHAVSQSVQASREIVIESRREADELDTMAKQLAGSLAALANSTADFMAELEAA